MRYKWLVRVVLLSAVLTLGACGGEQQSTLSPAIQESLSSESGLPPLSELDSWRSADAIHTFTIPVTEPTWERHTEVINDYLAFMPPPEELGYAIYQVDPPFGELRLLAASGQGEMWLLVADYGAGRWVSAPFEDGQAEIDLTQLSNPYSPSGYIYPGVICPAGRIGRLLSLVIEHDDLDLPWNLQISADDAGITLTWDELPVDSYRILRSTLAADAAPYHVGTVTEEYLDGNTFSETVPSDGTGRWVAENMDNGTPDDPSDDFPAIAPAVDYYYRLEPVLRGEVGPASPEVNAQVGWGNRRTIRREWPDTTNQSLLFGRYIDGGHLTEAQLQWCAENMIGATGGLQSEIDYIRNYNPDFIALGAHWAALSSSNYQNSSTFRKDDDGLMAEYLAQFYGNEEDIDSAFPYVDRHEDWFAHDSASEKYNQRSTNGWDDNESYAFCYWMDPISRWAAYVGTNLKQLLGEDCYDGWQLDGAHANWSVSPPFYEALDYEDLYDYLLPGLDGLFEAVSSSDEAHPLKPYLFADSWHGWTYDFSEYEYPALDYSACDGVVLSAFIDNGGGANNIWEFKELTAPRVLEWQDEGKVVVLQARGNPQYEYYPELRMVEYCCYLLIRGSRTYFYLSPDPDWTSICYDNVFWYPMYSWESGAPLNGPVTSVEDLVVDYGGFAEYYRRDFENGFVVVMPEDMEYYVNDGKLYEYLECTGGGAVAEDGSVDGQAVWKPMSDQGLPGFAMWGPGGWILREVEE